MTAFSTLNAAPVNSQALHNTYYILEVNAATVPITVNLVQAGQINARPIGSVLINGPLPAIPLVQTHILSVANAIIAVAAESPTLTMIYLMQVNNARIPLTSDHVVLAKTQGGALLVTVETPAAVVYRFSFQGVKA